MKCWQRSSDRRIPTVFALSLLLAGFPLGCASPGPPRPPSLNLPQPVTDLTAQRVGDQVLLHWTTPTKTTDGLPIKQNLTARICRTALPASPAIPAAKPTPAASLSPTFAPPLATPAPPCNVVVRVAIHAGAGSATDSLPAPLTADPVAVLDYRVEIENAAARIAGPSNPAFSAAGTAPPPVESLHATAIPSGAMLEWTAASTPTLGRPAPFLDLYRIDPALVTPPRNSAKTSSSKAGPTKAKSSQPLHLAGQESAEVHLRASSPATGTVDPTARFGRTYLYTAQRVRPVQINGHALELRSSVSPTVTLTLRDTFPPASPTGLATIPTTTPQPGIDLSWQPNTEADLAGYIVYRRATSETAASRLTPTAIPGSAFRDTTASPGQHYAYTVTAIDASNNESKPSSEVEEVLPQP